MKQFRHELHIKSPKFKQIAEAVAKYGHYYFERTQKRKPTGYKKNGNYIIIEGDILNG